MLRGWDEGYSIPSLGIAIHPAARELGMGRLLMNFLHVSASRRGASQVRLRVQNENINAIKMYESYGYIFDVNATPLDYLVGYKKL